MKIYVFFFDVDMFLCVCVFKQLKLCVVVGCGSLRGGGFNNKGGSVGGVCGGNFGGFGKF